MFNEFIVINEWRLLPPHSSIRGVLAHTKLTKRPTAPPPAPAPAPAPPPSTAPAPTTPVTPLIRGPIFKSSSTAPNPIASSSQTQSPLKSVVDSFAADGTITQAVESGVQGIHLPELFRASVHGLAATGVVQDVVRKIELVPAPAAKEAEEEFSIGGGGEEVVGWGEGWDGRGSWGGAEFDGAEGGAGGEGDGCGLVGQGEGRSGRGGGVIG